MCMFMTLVWYPKGMLNTGWKLCIPRKGFSKSIIIGSLKAAGKWLEFRHLQWLLPTSQYYIWYISFECHKNCKSCNKKLELMKMLDEELHGIVAPLKWSTCYFSNRNRLHDRMTVLWMPGAVLFSCCHWIYVTHSLFLAYQTILVGIMINSCCSSLSYFHTVITAWEVHRLA